MGERFTALPPGKGAWIEEPCRRLQLGPSTNPRRVATHPQGERVGSPPRPTSSSQAAPPPTSIDPDHLTCSVRLLRVFPSPPRSRDQRKSENEGAFSPLVRHGCT